MVTAVAAAAGGGVDGGVPVSGSDILSVMDTAGSGVGAAICVGAAADGSGGVKGGGCSGRGGVSGKRIPVLDEPRSRTSTTLSSFFEALATNLFRITN